MAHRALFVTLPGLAPWCAQELRELGLADATARADGGGAWVDATVADPGELARACWLGRLVVRGLWLLDDFDLDPALPSLEPLRDRVAALGDALVRWIPPGRTIAGRSTRRGTHTFTSPEVERMTGAGAFRAAETAWGAAPTVNLSDPDVTIRTDVCDGRAVTGIDFVGKRGLDRRPTPGPHHHAGCSPVVAAALLRIAGWRPDADTDADVLCDPMCGGGTILVEALSIASGLPAGWWRRGTLAFERLVAADGAPVVDPALTAGERPDNGMRPKLVANDSAGRSVDLAIGCVQQAGFSPSAVEFHRLDVNEFATAIAPNSIDRLVVNPPYGIKIGSKRALKEAYGGIARCCADLLAARGTAVALLPGPGRLQRPLESVGLTGEVVTTVQISEIAAAVVRVAIPNRA